jgi:two-component system sensor histidine kinase VicK
LDKLFKIIPRKYRREYRNYYMLQNLVAVRTCSGIFLILNVIIRILYYAFPESLTRAENFPEFNFTNWLYLIITPLFFISSYMLIVDYREKRKAYNFHTLYAYCFSLYLIGCGIFSSMIATADPSSALTLYMIPLVIVSIMFVFELHETIVLLIGIELVFTSFLLYSQTNANELVYNQLISVILLTGFYLTSRYFYTYKANYYKQVLEIREKNTEIENAGNFKNQVLGMVAHDLRNPLAAIESTAMLIEMDELDGDMRENIDMIKASCVKARGIITDLLDAARNEDKNVFETTEVDLNVFLRKIIDSWKTHNTTKNVLVFKSAFIPLYAPVNREKLHRVMDNLITNAIKFSKDKEKIEIQLDKEYGMAIIQVIDHGLGIPKEMIPHLFERFSKAGRAGIRGEQSTGLGLSIVKQIVENHKGRIKVESEEGKGSTFTIYLPANKT